jgi:nucleotide-binding universal stress UspA family protein
MTAPPSFKRVLVPVDGSPCSSVALDYALRLAKLHAGCILACNIIDFATLVVEASSGYVEADGSSSQERILSEAAERADDVGVELSTFKLEGRPVAEILDCGTREAADVIVMGTHGRRGLRRFLLGSTTEGVLRNAGQPVITVHEDTRADVPPKTIVVAADDSEPSDAAVDCAIGIAARERSRLVLCSVVPLPGYIVDLEPYGFDVTDVVSECEDDAKRLLRHAEEQARLADVESTLQVIPTGEPIDEILATVESRHADLLIMGTHGRRGFQRMLLGSVAEGVVRRSATPVMVVPSPSLLRNVRGARVALVDDVR